MASARKSFPSDHPIIVTFLIFAIIGFMYLAADVLKPLALAVLLAFALAPICERLERAGMPRFLAAALTVLLTLGVLGFVGYKLGGQLNSMAKELPKRETNIIARLKWLKLDQAGSINEVNRVVQDVSETIAPRRASRRPSPIAWSRSGSSIRAGRTC